MKKIGPEIALALVCVPMLATGSGCATPETQEATVATSYWGSIGGTSTHKYILKNDKGMIVELTDYGATITRLVVPDRDGVPVDVVLGFDTAEEYPEKSQYFGCTVGRVGNRIAGGRFELDGEAYQLATNDGTNHLHGGERGFDKHIWEAELFADASGLRVRFTRTSPDGEEGYPGNLHATVEYTLRTGKNDLIVSMHATADAATPCNIVHHTYWNLGGHDSGSILDAELEIPASRYTPVDDTFIPTGELADVGGTALDFREAKPIGRDIGAFPADGEDPGGYDHNFVLDRGDNLYASAASLRDPGTGIAMMLFTDQPGLQFYSGNFLNGMAGKGGAIYAKNGALCLETQVFPDAVNHAGEEGWPGAILRPGEKYEHLMVHSFSSE